MRKVYLDNGSTSFPKAPGTGEAMSDFMTNVGCNVSRGGYQSAYAMGEVVYETRERFAKLFNFPQPGKVVFTPGITYSLNYVIQGLLRPGDHLIISAMEHNAVSRPAYKLKEHGVEVTVCPCDKEGYLDLDAFEKAIKKNTRLVVINHASNVAGTLQDAEAIGRICMHHGVYFALDTAQSAGTVPIDFQKMHLDALCVTGHKGLLGPQGIGALMMTDAFAQELQPVILGGTGSVSHLQTMPDFLPDKFEAGTMNLPGIVGMHKALEFILEKTPEKIGAQELDRAMRFIDGLKEIPQAHVIGPQGREGRTAVVSVDFDEIDNAEMSSILDSEFGIMTRCALHCAPLAHKTLGTFPEGTVRFAFGYWTTEEEVDYALNAIRSVYAE
jgi:cysteine desulfurase family protein